MDSEQLQRLTFYLALVFLSITYGFASSRLGWFPSNLFERAIEQARQVTSPPAFLTPRVYERQGARTLAEGRVAPGATLVASTWKGPDGWEPGFRLIDTDGDVLHAWSVDPEQLFDTTEERRQLGRADIDIQGSHFFPNGDVLFNLEYAGTLRIDACSRVRWHLTGGGHHSVARAGDGTFWIPGVSAQPTVETPHHPDGPPGLERPVFQEHLRRISGDGKVLERIHVTDLLYENDLQRHIFKTSHGEPADLVHLNDIDPLPAELADQFPLFEAGDLAVSLRNLDLEIGRAHV